jgi:N-acetylmuramoyl-L-alanine amidase
VRNILKALCILTFAAILTLPGLSLASERKFTIVIDPGHGGPDTGAIHKQKGDVTLTEKHFTLLLAKDLARELVIRGHRVNLTRTDDREVLLSDRTALANRLRADIFISLHMNSSSDAVRSGGVETFILNHATDTTSKRLADLENAVLKGSQVNAASGSSQVSLIMKDLILDANLAPSKELACSVQARIKHAATDRGVKQALFYVLLGTDMPSILIESGFMNLKEDRDRILFSKQRLTLAAEIAAAVDDYRLKRSPKRCQIRSEKQFIRKEEPTPRPKDRI